MLRNAGNQHSLWPTFAEIPSGWTQVHGPTTRESCLAYVEKNWTDMRPQSLINDMG